MRTYRKLARLPTPGDPDYERRLQVALEEGQRTMAQALQEIDSAPCLSAVLTASQALTANTLTTLAFDSVLIDTHGWWAGNAYTPKLAGLYRASWGVNFHEAGGIAAGVFAYSQCGGRMAITNGGGGADIHVGGSVLVDCDGAATAIKVEGLIQSGTSPVAFASGTPYRCWLDINYVGRKG